MRRVLRLAVLACACVVAYGGGGLTLASARSSGPAPPAYNCPAKQLAARKTVWLGPYVSADEVRIGEHSRVTIRWFGPDGKVVREIVEPGGVICISDYLGEGKALYSVNGDWSFSPVEREGINTLSTTPEAYLISYNPKEDLICGDLYWHGKLVASVGPFYQHIQAGFDLGADGSTAIIVWDGPGKKTPQVIAMTRTGEVRVRADCELPEEGSTIVAPGARGVIVDSWSAEGGKTFYGSDGRQVTLPAGFDFRLWLPDTTKALVAKSLSGFGDDYELVDCQTGASLWRLELPQPARVGPLGVAGEYLLFGGTERNDTLGGPPGEVRTLYAVEAATGRIAAHWLPASSYAGGWGSYALRLRQLDGKYFLLSDAEVSEFDPEDIRAKRNRWR